MERAAQNEVIKRLRSTEGHVRGVLHMVDEGQSCAAILQQIRAIQGSLRQVSLLVMEQHLDGCLREVWDESKEDVCQQMRNELASLLLQKS